MMRQRGEMTPEGKGFKRELDQRYREAGARHPHAHGDGSSPEGKSAVRPRSATASSSCASAKAVICKKGEVEDRLD